MVSNPERLIQPLPLPTAPKVTGDKQGPVSVRDAYGDYLADSYPWQWFCTFTSERITHPEAMFKAFRVWVNKLNRSISGRRAPLSEQVVWVVATERHKSGNPHMHAILWHRHDLNQLAMRNHWQKVWQEMQGFASVEKPHNRQRATRYCAKYLSKEGELHFGPSFGVHAKLIELH